VLKHYTKFQLYRIKIIKLKGRDKVVPGNNRDLHCPRVPKKKSEIVLLNRATILENKKKNLIYSLK